MGRFQLNALIERDTGGFGYFDAISEERVFLPFAWMDEGVEGPSEVGFLRASYDVRKISAGSTNVDKVVLRCLSYLHRAVPYSDVMCCGF